MTQRSRTYLKGRFENNDIPNATDYGDFIDSFLNLTTSGTETMNGSLVVSGNLSTTNVSASEAYFSGHVHYGYATVSALGTTAGSAAAFSTDVTLVKVTDAQERGVIGDHFRAGIQNKVVNDTASVTAAYVYPPSGTTFIGASFTTAQNSPLLIAAGQTIELLHVNTSSVAFVRY